MVSIEVSSGSEARPGRVEELYRSHVPGAVRLAYLLTGDADAAQDIAHDAFVRTTGRLRHLQHPDSYAAYRSRVYDLPGQLAGQAKVFIIPGQQGTTPSGTLVASDGAGNELGRAQIPSDQSEQSP